MEEKMLTGGLHLSEGEKKTKGVPVRVCLAGPQAVSGTGPNHLPGVQIVFLFSFLLFSFLFSFSFITFANLIQIRPNHFQKFSKNQCNDLTLQEI
jgi:hypothetical protein